MVENSVCCWAGTKGYLLTGSWELLTAVAMETLKAAQMATREVESMACHWVGKMVQYLVVK
jgi:hypothetical protein